MKKACAMGRAMSVLIFGDADSQRGLLATILKERAQPGELEVAEASTLEEATSYFRRHHPDLILISASTAEQTRLAALVRREEGRRHTGVIVVSGCQDEDDGDFGVVCLEMGADDYLRTSVSPEEMMARVRGVLRLKAMTDELRSANHRLRILSLTDELTGLANMRSFNHAFAEALRRCRKGATPLAVIMMDLDHFKSVNDTANHLVGSHVLAETGRLLRVSGALGKGDVAARYGGDEFIMLCEAATAAEALHKAENIRRLIEWQVFERDGCEIRVTASLGVAWVGASFDGRGEDLIKAADAMLYKSKHQGRNRVSLMTLRYPVDLGDGLEPAEAAAPAARQESASAWLARRGR